MIWNHKQNELINHFGYLRLLQLHRFGLYYITIISYSNFYTYVWSFYVLRTYILFFLHQYFGSKIGSQISHVGKNCVCSKNVLIWRTNVVKEWDPWNLTLLQNYQLSYSLQKDTQQDLNISLFLVWFICLGRFMDQNYLFVHHPLYSKLCVALNNIQHQY